MNNFTSLIELDHLKCPICQRPSLAEYSLIAPALVKCQECGAVWVHAFIQGYWQGYHKHASELSGEVRNGN